MEKTTNTQEVKKIVFKDPYVNRPVTIPTNPGTKFLPQYIEDINSDGKKYLKEIKPINVEEIIQESAIGTDIYEIVDKCLKTGDQSLINKGKGEYGDFTNMPTTRIEALQQIMKAEKEFNQLNKEIRAQFDNDINVFKHSLMDGSFNQRMLKYEESIKPKVTTEEPKGELKNE